MGMAVLVGASAALQFAAGVLALRLIRVTGATNSWALIACGLWGMAARRGLSLMHVLQPAHQLALDLGFEVLGLVTSAAMLAGVLLIGPLFRGLRTARERAEQVAREKEELAVGLEQAMASLKILSGILPICASCKSIRDEQGRWNPIETYVRDRTDAEFTHGLCPECRVRLYPGLGRREP
ncbi:MAG: hypothetical protein HZB55_16350 [Deltaproteobacteria bacterium]|nr:hypothetical protein [Deltaproteobacteria bacterium]